MKGAKVYLKAVNNYINAEKAEGNFNDASEEKPKKKKSKPKIVCDGNKCRRVPAKKKSAYKTVTTKSKGTTQRLSARSYMDDGGQEGDICDIRNDGELRCLLLRKNGSPYWAKLGSPKADAFGCGSEKSCMA